LAQFPLPDALTGRLVAVAALTGMLVAAAGTLVLPVDELAGDRAQAATTKMSSRLPTMR
jgi:hypothetical protein